MEYRINGFEQIEAFYTWVFNNADKQVRPQHISLYMFLLMQNNRKRWIEWFTLPYEDAMECSGIGSRSTYYKTLHQLNDWGLIKYVAGVNNVKAPIISIKQLSKNGLLPIPLTEPLGEPLTEPLGEHLYITYNGVKDNGVISDPLVSETIDSLSERFDEIKPTQEGEVHYKKIKIAIKVYKAYCEIYEKTAYKEIAAKEWIDKVSKIPADNPEKIADALYAAKRYNTFGYSKAANIEYLIKNWSEFTADIRRAFKNNKK
jgi:hypothetical protein